MNPLEELTHDQLVARLRQLETEVEEGAQERLAHDLNVHQIELEMQNRELREAQVQLEESRARYADLFELAPIAYLTLDRELCISDGNLAAASLLGVARSHLIGRPLSTFAAAAAGDSIPAHVARCLEEQRRIIEDIDLRVRGGALISVHVVSTPIQDLAGAVRGCRMALTEITALKRSEEQLRLLARASSVLARSFEHQENLGHVVRLCVPALADVCFLDLKGEGGHPWRLAAAFADPRKQLLSDAGELLPAARDPLSPQATVLRTGQPIHVADCTAPDSAGGIRGTEYEALVEGGARSMLVVPLMCAAEVQGALALIITTSGRTYGPSDVGFAQDLATRMGVAIDNGELYATATEALRTRDAVLSIVSHDLRNPLNAVVLALNHLREEAPEHDRRDGRRHLEVIQRSAERMERMINDLLDLSSIQEGRLAIHAREHHAADLMRGITPVFQAEAEQKEIELVMRVADVQAPVRCDRDRFQQILANLVGNALKFTPRLGKVVIDVEDQGDFARFRVHDSGPGIPAKAMPHIFKRYWQAPEAAKYGRGLGLYIAKVLVEAQGGRIGVESPETGGASFYFTLPLGDQGQRPAVVRDPLVLVVEDDPDARELLQRALQRRSYAVVAAADGEEAMTYLASDARPPSLILLDLGLPIVDGRAVMRMLKARPDQADIPVLLVSSEPDLQTTASSLGAVAAIKKPIDLAHLLELVGRHAGQPAG